MHTEARITTKSGRSSFTVPFKAFCFHFYLFLHIFSLFWPQPVSLTFFPSLPRSLSITLFFPLSFWQCHACCWHSEHRQPGKVFLSLSFLKNRVCRVKSSCGLPAAAAGKNPQQECGAERRTQGQKMPNIGQKWPRNSQENTKFSSSCVSLWEVKETQIPQASECTHDHLLELFDLGKFCRQYLKRQFISELWEDRTGSRKLDWVQKM